jgi:hypothetical protein
MRVEARDKNESGVSTCLETPLWALALMPKLFRNMNAILVTL